MAVLVNREVEEWRKQCPLLLWMKKRGYTGVRGGNTPSMIHKIKDWAGVRSRQAVYAWLYGFALPRSRAMSRLKVHTGITLDAWMKWFDRKPVEVEETCDFNSTPRPTEASGDL